MQFSAYCVYHRVVRVPGVKGASEFSLACVCVCVCECVVSAPVAGCQLSLMDGDKRKARDAGRTGKVQATGYGASLH